jgi:hypothetical protein
MRCKNYKKAIEERLSVSFVNIESSSKKLSGDTGKSLSL